MATDIFLKLETIPGESKDGDHPGEIDVLSWDTTANQTASASTAGGSGSGRVSHEDITITKHVDKASANLWQWCNTGTVIPTGKITVGRAGGEGAEAKRQEYLLIELKRIIVSYYHLGNAVGEEMPIETIRLNYECIQYTYTPQAGEGAGDGAVPNSYNLKANKATFEVVK